MPIDHVAIFNTSNLERGIFHLSEYDSILTTELTPLLFAKHRGSRMNLLTKNIVENMYLCVDRCNDGLSDILNRVPPEWNIDIAHKEILLRQQITANKPWIAEIAALFTEFIEISYTKI
jgi:hypothetical protein